MKIRFFAVLIGVIVSGFVVGDTDKQAHATLVATDAIMQGAIVAPDKVDMEPVSVIFRGERSLVDKNGFFSFVKKNDREAFESIPLKQKMKQVVEEADAVDSTKMESPSPLLTPKIKQDKYYLLITQNIDRVVEGLNDVAGFRQVAGAPHLFFSFIIQNSTRPSGEIVIKPTSLEKRNYLYAPDRTIVVLMNPNRVKKVEYWPFDLNAQFIQIPRIVLLTEQEILERKLEKNPDRFEGQSLPGNNIGRQAAKSNFLSLELKPFFEEQDKVVVWKQQRPGRDTQGGSQPIKVEMPVY